MAASDTKQLQLQISASAELLIRNLKTADSAVAEFQQSTNKRLASIDERYAALGKLKGGLSSLAAGGLAAVAGVATSATLIDLAKRGLDYASSLQEVSQQLGVTSKDLQTYRYAASQVGISQEDIDKGLSKLTQTMGKAELGAEGPIKAFGALGISLANLKGSTAGDIIPKIADALEKVTDPAQRAAIEVELFGKTGQKLDTLLAGGSAGVNGLTSAARDLGLVLSDEQIANADKTADKLSEVKQVLEANIAKVVADNAGAIFQLAAALERAGAAAVQAFAQFQNAGDKFDLDHPNLSRLSSNIRGVDPAKERTESFDRLLQTDAGRRILKQRNQQQYADLNAGNTFALGADGRGIPENAQSRIQERARLRADRKAILAAQIASHQPVVQQPGTKIPDGVDLPQILAPAGPKGKSADQLAREAAAAAKKDHADQRRANDTLNREQLDAASASADLSGDPNERLLIEQQRVDLARKGKDDDLELAALDNRYIAANLDRLKKINADTAEIDKQILTQRRAQEVDQAAYDRTRASEDDQLAVLDIQARLALVAKDRHGIEKRILALKQQEEREALQRVVDDKNNRYSPDDKKLAGEQLARLPDKQAAEQASQAKDQQGPLAAYRDQLVAATGDMNEALQGVAARGIQSLEDGLLGVIDGTKSVGEAFRDMAKSIIADLARIAIEKAIVSALGSVFGLSDGGPLNAIPGRADGGSLGGLIQGPGTERSDSILAMLSGPGGGAVRLSNREFIVNAAATSANLPLLHAINAGRGKRFAEGGPLSGLSLSRLPAADRLAGARDGAPIAITLAVTKGEAFAAEVVSVSGPHTLRILQAAAPDIVSAATTHTINKLRTPTL